MKQILSHSRLDDSFTYSAGSDIRCLYCRSKTPQFLLTIQPTEAHAKMNEMLKNMKRVKKIWHVQESRYMHNIYYHADSKWFPLRDSHRASTCHLPCGPVSMCTVLRTRRLQHTMNISLTHLQTHTHTNTRLSGLLRPICLEHICQCSIKNPSDKRFKWLPLWVMSSCISEEAFTAQQMKTDEKDHPLRLDLAFVPQWH